MHIGPEDDERAGLAPLTQAETNRRWAELCKRFRKLEEARMSPDTVKLKGGDLFR